MATLVSVFGDDGVELFLDDAALAFIAGENCVVLGNQRHESVVFVLQFLTFHRSEFAQLHVEDCAGLNVVNLKKFHQALLSIRSRWTSANECNDFVDAIDGLEQTTQDMCAFFSFTFAVLRTTLDDFDLMSNPVGDKRVEGERTWYAIDERQHVAAEIVL
jgi:hypothetical protein